MEKARQETKTRRQLQAEQTKDRLFEAAVSLLSEKDFEKITIREIVARADVSIGTFYNYYDAKVDVFYETYRMADQYFQDVVAPALCQPCVLDRILLYFEHYARYNSEFTDMKMTRILYNPDNQWFNRDPQDGMVGVLINTVRRGMEDGQLTGGDSAEEAASYLMIAARGLVYHWCTTNGSYPLTPAMLHFVRRLMQAYLPHPAREVCP